MAGKAHISIYQNTAMRYWRRAYGSFMNIRQGGKASKKEKGYWNEFLQGLIAEWPGYDIQANINEQYHNRQKSIQEEVKRDLRGIGVR